MIIPQPPPPRLQKLALAPNKTSCSDDNDFMNLFTGRDEGKLDSALSPPVDFPPFGFGPSNDAAAAVDIDELSALFDFHDSGPEKKKPVKAAPVQPPQVSVLDQEIDDAANIDEISMIFDSMVDESTSDFDIFVLNELMVPKSKKTKKEYKQPVVAAPTPPNAEQEQRRQMCQDLGLSEGFMKRLSQTKTSTAPMMKELPKSYVPLQTFIPSSAYAADYRCFQATPFARGEIDPRIPTTSIPKIDAPQRPLFETLPFEPTEAVANVKEKHDPATCDICQSNKTPQRKAILHRWRLRRLKRNWSRGPRYDGRSSVATTRKRVNGRFVSSCKWI